MDDVMYAWFDRQNVVRASATGPRSQEAEVREAARELLREYAERRNLSLEDFTLWRGPAPVPST